MAHRSRQQRRCRLFRRHRHSRLQSRPLHDRPAARSISCNLKIFEPGRKLDDYGHAVIRFENGALGTVTASQISHGRENDLFIEIDGTKGAIQWQQEDPNK